MAPPPAGATREELIHLAIDAIAAARSLADLMIIELRKPAPDVVQLTDDLRDIMDRWDHLAEILTRLWNLPRPS